MAPLIAGERAGGENDDVKSRGIVDLFLAREGYVPASEPLNVFFVSFHSSQLTARWRHTLLNREGSMPRECAHQGCTKGPSYGVAGSKKPEYCAQHRKGGMVNVVSKRCAHHGCAKGPSYGKAGSKKAEYCRDHAEDGMVNVTHKRCAHHGCIKVAQYSKAGGGVLL